MFFHLKGHGVIPTRFKCTSDLISFETRLIKYCYIMDTKNINESLLQNICDTKIRNSYCSCPS